MSESASVSETTTSRPPKLRRRRAPLPFDSELFGAPLGETVEERDRRRAKLRQQVKQRKAKAAGRHAKSRGADGVNERTRGAEGRLP